VVKRALELNATRVILAHNHPSGVPEPSQVDIEITRLLMESLKMFEIEVLDHIVVGGTQTTSFAASGLL
jgi:DNA repair protein RadC